MKQASLIIDVPFFDVDAMHVVWHGHYIKYIEMARSELLRTFNYDYPDMEANGHLWPIVDLRLKYVASATYGQHIRVTATLAEWEHRLKMNYEIRCVESNELLTKATSVQVAVCKKTREMLFESPDIVFEKLGVDRS